jgi:hypothetical protein
VGLEAAPHARVAGHVHQMHRARRLRALETPSEGCLSVMDKMTSSSHTVMASTAMNPRQEAAQVKIRMGLRACSRMSSSAVLDLFCV